MSIFQSDNVQIAYDIKGRGKPIILLHGFASNRKVNWKTTGWYETLSESGRQVIAVDLRGHGESEKIYSPPAYSPVHMAGDVVRLMDHLGIERADLMGYSMGGWISSHLLLSNPDRLFSVVLGGVGAALLEYHNVSGEIAQALRTQNPQSITDLFIRALRDFAVLVKNDLQALAACIEGVYEGQPPELSQTNRPVLVISGRNDEVVGDSYEFAKYIPGVELVLIPDCDHLTALADDRYKKAVLKFLNRHSKNSIPEKLKG